MLKETLKGQGEGSIKETIIKEVRSILKYELS